MAVSENEEEQAVWGECQNSELISAEIVLSFWYCPEKEPCAVKK